MVVSLLPRPAGQPRGHPPEGGAFLPAVLIGGVLRFLDVPVPEDMEGRALEAAFEELPEPRFRTAPERTHAADEDAYDEDEARELEERLKGLGYL